MLLSLQLVTIHFAFSAKYIVAFNYSIISKIKDELNLFFRKPWLQYQCKSSCGVTFVWVFVFLGGMIIFTRNSARSNIENHFLGTEYNLIPELDENPQMRI